MELQAVLWNESHTSEFLGCSVSITSAVNEGRVNLGTQNLRGAEAGWSEFALGTSLQTLLLLVNLHATPL